MTKPPVNIATLRRLHKADELDQLYGSLWPDGAGDFAEEWDERAAIMEHLGGLNRDIAEQMAYQRVCERRGFE